jgi:hypothetical protein
MSTRTCGSSGNDQQENDDSQAGQPDANTTKD